MGETAAEDENEWLLRARGRYPAAQLVDRRAPAAGRVVGGDPDALPQDRARPLVLQRQLEQVARMTRGQSHHLATLSEAIEVMELVEQIVARH